MAQKKVPLAILASKDAICKMIGPFLLILILPIDLSVQPPLPPGSGGSLFGVSQHDEKG
jgi:hypothetical protein